VAEGLARLRAAWPLLVPVFLAAVLHARGFGGYWLGDDLPNLHRTHEWAQAGNLWSDTARQFLSPITGGGSFIRPMVIASFSLNYAISGPGYAGWFALNFLVHLASVLLVAWIVLALGRRLGADGRWPALVAGLVFGTSPAIAEGVYWLSARGDGWVTLLSLAAVAVWVRDDARGTRHALWAYPVLLVLALGFKESAAILPLQMVLLALAWPGPRPRGQWEGVIAGLALMALYFGYRAVLFGSLFQTYLPRPEGEAAWWVRLAEAARSLPDWWSGLTGERPGRAAAYVLLLLAGTVVTLVRCWGPRLRLGVAFLLAGAGLLVATAANLGAFPPSGESGRLFYGPFAWLALAIGTLTLQPAGATRSAADRVAAGLIVVSVLIGAGLLNATLRHVEQAQDRSRALVAALAAWEEGTQVTMLLIPELQGPVVAFRNGQGGIVLPPLQSQPMLHRVVPSLPGDIPKRYDEFAAGLGTRLVKIQPQRADAATLRDLLQRDAASWPALACWVPGDRRIFRLDPVDPSDRDEWIRRVRTYAQRCMPEERSRP
jgi:hypothetical protein